MAPAGLNPASFVAQADLKVLDPVWTTAYITRNHSYLVYDTLFGTDENLQVQPQMIDRTTVSPDGMKYTFTLRDGLRWHDGQPVLSEDCVESLKRWGRSYRFGQLLMAARRDTIRLIVGIGGSATNDGGAGMAQALGYRLLDKSGTDLPRGGAALARLERIDASGFKPWAPAVEVRVACDVTNPLTGSRGASAVYGPQKGADKAAVRELDAALARLAEVIERDLGKRVADVPGAGAAGGTGAGLMAFLDA